jgi:hypothetical protein
MAEAKKMAKEKKEEKKKNLLSLSRNTRSNKNESLSDDQLQSSTEAMRLAISKGGKIDAQMAFQAIFLMLERLESAISENNVLKERIYELEEEVSTLKDTVTRVEMDNCKCKVIIRGAPPHKDSKERETIDQTTAVVMAILNKAEFPGDHEIVSSRRIYFKDDKKKIPSLAVQFKSQLDTINFMRSLKNLKNDDLYSKIRVSKEIPASLTGELKTLEEQAYNLRQQEKGLKTLIIPRGVHLILLVKKPGQNDFNEAKM